MTDPNKIDLFLAHPFYNLVNQIGLTIDDPDLYLISLISSLALPDICGALGSSDGLASGAKYKAWFDKWVSPKYQIDGSTSLSGNDCYMLRCAVLHQGRMTHTKSNFKGVIFVKPGAINAKFHNNIIDEYLNIDIYDFCFDMINSATDWFETVAGTDPFEDNFEKSMQIHFDGFGPIQGMPVIA